MSLRDKLIDDVGYDGADRRKYRVRSGEDLNFMSSVSAALLLNHPRRIRVLLWSSFLVVLWLIVWAYYAEIDDLTRGTGKVIPSNQLQVIQNLEGGIVSDILVDEGDSVNEGDVLVKIDATGLQSSFDENRLRYDELLAKSIRLQAEASGQPFSVDAPTRQRIPELLRHEKSLYDSNNEQLQSKLRIYEQQIVQKRSEYAENEMKIEQLGLNFELIKREMAISEPLVANGVVSEVEFLKLQRQAGDIESELKSAKLLKPRLVSVIEEAKNKLEEVRLDFRNRAKEQLNETSAEMARLEKTNVARLDKVERTLVRSPVTGTVKRLYVNTIGGVVRPGMDIVEVVPTQDTLLVEAKIRPADIAFLRPGQKAIVKFSAYDFSIYGSLEGELKHISADTIIDEGDKQSYYLVRVHTDSDHLGSDEKPLKIKVGMTADIDIVTGKKTVLDYILKPILRAKNNALSER